MTIVFQGGGSLIQLSERSVQGYCGMVTGPILPRGTRLLLRHSNAEENQEVLIDRKISR